MEFVDVLNSLWEASTGLFDFIRNIPNMISQCLGGFPPALITILLAGFLIIIAIRILEIVF